MGRKKEQAQSQALERSVLLRAILFGLLSQTVGCLAGSPCDGRILNENEAEECAPECRVHATREAPEAPCGPRVPVILCMRTPLIGSDTTTCLTDPATGFRYYTATDYGVGEDTGLAYCAEQGEPSCPSP